MEPSPASNPNVTSSQPNSGQATRHSHDEQNLAEFPLVLLTTGQSSTGRHTLEYQEAVRHPRTGAEIIRKVTITGAGKFGLPTSMDEEVLMALIYLTLEDKLKNGFDDPMVYFTRRQLFEILGWPDTGHYYQRLKQSMTRWKGVNIFYENWWDNLVQDYVADIGGFNLLDNFKLTDARRKEPPQLALPFTDSETKQALCFIKWNMTPFGGFKNGNLKAVDLDAFFSLPTPAAKRAYRYLNFRLPESGQQDYDLRNFACQHIGFASSYKPGRLRTQVQETIVSPLERQSFIEPMPLKRRFIKKNGRDHVIFARKVSAEPLGSQRLPALSAAGGNLSTQAAGSPIVHELTRRGLGGKVAKEFCATYNADYLEQKIDYFDYAMGTQEIKKPAAWLRKAIEDEYGPPPGYLPREERERLAELQRQEAEAKAAKQQADIVRERLEREEQAAADKRKHNITAHLESLSADAFAQLDADSIQWDSPEAVAGEIGYFKNSLQDNRRRRFVDHLMKTGHIKPSYT